MSKKEKFKQNLNGVFDGLDIERINKAGDDLLKKISPLFERMNQEHSKLITPKSKKNVKWDGENISVNLIEDGRVLINFSSLEAANKFYSDFESMRSNKLTKFLRKCRLL